MKNSIYTLFLISILSISLTSYSQTVTEEWVARYNGPVNGDDWAFAIAIDDLGNVYVTGGSDGIGTGTDYLTIKYNPSGIQEWVARYNGPGNSFDGAYAIAVDGFGNVYVTGYSFGSGTGADYATIKYNSDGVEQWVARYNRVGNNDDRAFALVIDGSGNVYVTGYSYGSGTGADYATIKYNTDGIQQWVARYNGPGNTHDYANSIAIDIFNNVYVTGESTGSGTGSDYATIKYNTDGAEQWIVRYNGPGNGSDQARDLAVDGSGNVYVTGESSNSGSGTDYATIKYNSNGIQQWVAIYNGTGNSDDRANALAIDSSGYVYVTGQSNNSSGNLDYATIKYNSDGIQQWVTRYNGPGNAHDYAYAIALDGFGNSYVTGRSVGSGTGSDYATIKYNSGGLQQWVARYNGPGNGVDVAWDLAIDGFGNVYVAGQSTGIEIVFDFATLKYSQPTRIQTISSEIPEQFSLSQNFPNPFNPETTITFAIPQARQTKLTIYDALGREVQILINEILQPGNYEYNFNASSVPSGIYYYKLETENFSQSKKMILLK